MGDGATRPDGDVSVDAGPGQIDPGSYRDPAGRVIHDGGAVYRTLSPRALEDWQALEQTRFFGEWTDRGAVVETEPVDDRPDLTEGWAGLLRHERIPFVSYPYEWTFTMLKDAALLQLDLLSAALGENMILKDATPFNVQWRGSRPVFIDIGSFERLPAGEPWIAYRQFCRQYLYPLMLRSYVGVPYQPWLRGDPEGLTADQIDRMLGAGARRRLGVLLHVTLQARAERRYAQAERDVRSELREAGFGKQLIEVNVRRLRRLIEGLTWDDASSWTEYRSCEHVGRDRREKEGFLDAMLDGRVLDLVWDVGANDGHFSRLVADRAGTVVAMDADEAVLDDLYRRLRSEGVGNVLPLLVDLSNPSPGLGWRLSERAPLERRGLPDLLICFAVVHHLVVGANVPLGAVIDWLASMGGRVAFEWVPPDDPMVERLTANKRPHEVHADYSEEALRLHLDRHFLIEREQPLTGGGRILLALRPRPRP